MAWMSPALGCSGPEESEDRFKRGSELSGVGDEAWRVIGGRDCGDAQPQAAAQLGGQGGAQLTASGHQHFGRGRQRDQGRRVLAFQTGGEGQGEPEAGALAELAGGLDMAAHQLHQLAADGEAEPGASVFARSGGIELGKALEHSGQPGRRDAGAGIAHGDADGRGSYRVGWAGNGERGLDKDVAAL